MSFTEDTVIPSGTTIILLPLKTRMDSRFWKNPEVFDPDRFLHEDDLPKYANLTFGFGVRSCPGNISKQVNLHNDLINMKQGISFL